MFTLNLQLNWIFYSTDVMKRVLARPTTSTEVAQNSALQKLQ